MSTLYDAHSHLHDSWLTPHREQITADLTRVGVRAVVVNGTSETDWPEVVSLCASHADPRPTASLRPRLLPSFGLHPWDVGNRTDQWWNALTACLDADPQAFVGEIGLDRWILDRARPDDPRLRGLRRASLEEQLDVFRAQLELAAQRNRPASIHCLEAFGALHDVLRSAPLPACGFLLHAYSGPAEMVPVFARLGAYFSFNGAFLDPRKHRQRAVFTAVPIDRVLIETDAPAMRLPADREQFTLPPTAAGEAINHPANLAATYAGFATLREISLDHLVPTVARNFSRLFGFPGASAASSAMTHPDM